jgi:Tol biopolymer transport system component
MSKAKLAVVIFIAACSPATTTQPERPQTQANDMLFGAGVFSTGAYELPPTFTLDGRTAYFTVSTPAYGRLHVIMETHFDGGRWSEPQVAPFSGQYGDADPLISPDGSRLFFLSRRAATGRARERQDFDIWYVQREGLGWGEPQHVPGASGPSDEHYASVAADGTLYIAALRPDSRGRGDVYRVPLVNGVYGEPENLTVINSPDHHDTTPYIAPDQSYMIFSSFGRPEGNGSGGDLYLSFRRNGEWTQPKNIGVLVNTFRTEYCPVVSHDGRYLYFTSERGFADAPLGRRLSSQEWNRLLTTPGNGLGDTYRIEMNRVWDVIGDRP